MKKPNINLLAIIVAVPVIGMTIISPALTLIKDDLNISFSETQLILTLYFIFLALGQIISGPFSDKYGRKPILILAKLNEFLIPASAGNAVFIVGSELTALNKEFSIALTGRSTNPFK